MRPPLVSVVVPMRNEAPTIEACIRTFDVQEHPHDALEVIVVDGLSDDGSRDLVSRMALDRPWLRLVDNPDRRASSAFNRGIEASTGDYVCIVSSHGEVGPDFISRSLATLTETGASGVGGKLLHVGTDPVGRAIGAAMTSPFGMASPFRYANDRREVDTIGHPMYRRAALDEVGPFDESLERNSDYELNQRLRNAGHRLVFDPDIVTTYYPRGDLAGLARQFWDYGRWKAEIVRRDPSNLRWRHTVPSTFALTAVAAPLLVRFPLGRRVVSAGLGCYGVGVALAVSKARPGDGDVDRRALVAAFPLMHLTWGAAFLRGLVDPS